MKKSGIYMKTKLGWKKTFGGNKNENEFIAKRQM